MGAAAAPANTSLNYARHAPFTPLLRRRRRDRRLQRHPWRTNPCPPALRCPQARPAALHSLRQPTAASTRSPATAAPLASASPAAATVSTTRLPSGAARAPSPRWRSSSTPTSAAWPACASPTVRPAERDVWRWLRGGVFGAVAGACGRELGMAGSVVKRRLHAAAPHTHHPPALHADSPQPHLSQAAVRSPQATMPATRACWAWTPATASAPRSSCSRAASRSTRRSSRPTGASGRCGGGGVLGEAARGRVTRMMGVAAPHPGL